MFVAGDEHPIKADFPSFDEGELQNFLAVAFAAFARMNRVADVAAALREARIEPMANIAVAHPFSLIDQPKRGGWHAVVFETETLSVFGRHLEVAGEIRRVHPIIPKAVSVFGA